MSKTRAKQKENPFVTIEETNDLPREWVQVTVRLPVTKDKLALLKELAQADIAGDLESLIFHMAQKGFSDQFNLKLESTHKLGRYYADYLRKKYLSAETSKG